MAQFPGKSERIEAPYSRTFTTLSADIDLTTQVTQARNACSGMFVEAAAGDVLRWKDCSGTDNVKTFTAAFTGVLPFAATALVAEGSNPVVSVTCFWHPSTAT